MKILLVSDLHFGAESAQKDAITAMFVSVGRDADLILILGDLVEAETTKVKKELEEWLSTMQAYDLLHKIQVVVGNHDESWIQQLPDLETRDFATPMTINQRYVCIHGNDLAIWEHAQDYGWGERLGAAMKDRLLEWSRQGAWTPQLTENDYLIIGHCHVCFHHEKRRVLSPGTWKGDPRDDPNVGWYIMIETTQVCDEIKLRRWFSLDPKQKL